MMIKRLLGMVAVVAIVTLAKTSFEADAAGSLRPDSTPGMLVLLGSCLAGLGMWGRKQNRQGTTVDDSNPVLRGRAANFRGIFLVDDLIVLEGEKEKLLGLLQMKYEWIKDKAERKY